MQEEETINDFFIRIKDILESHANTIENYL
jgi:hypothetical protein